MYLDVGEPGLFISELKCVTLGVGLGNAGGGVRRRERGSRIYVFLYQVDEVMGVTCWHLGRGIR
jgi:hypothetical protein